MSVFCSEACSCSEGNKQAFKDLNMNLYRADSISSEIGHFHYFIGCSWGSVLGTLNYWISMLDKGTFVVFIIA